MNRGEVSVFGHHKNIFQLKQATMTSNRYVPPWLTCALTAFCMALPPLRPGARRQGRGRLHDVGGRDAALLPHQAGVVLHPLPRIPVPVQKMIDQQMKARPRKIVAKEPEAEAEAAPAEPARPVERRRSRGCSRAFPAVELQ